VSDENDVIAAVDSIADKIESDVELAATNLGLSVHEVIDRVSLEIKGRFPDA
jgi:ABC-type sulfate transport system permease component